MEKPNKDRRLANKFGAVLPDQVILYSGSTTEKVPFDAIERVMLVKYRVLYTNLILLLIGLSLLGCSALHWNPDQLAVQVLLLSGITVLAYSLTHKFYHYRLEIKEKNASLHLIKTNQFGRSCIKKLYYAILKNTYKPKVREPRLHLPSS